MGMSFGLPCWANFLGRMAVAVLVVGSSFFLAAPDSAAQDSVQEAAAKEDSGPTAQERAVAERFVQVLKRRPRPGTALDRVYGFHVQNGSLDDFIKTLQVADDAPDAGQNQMILGLLQSQRGKEAAAAEAFAKAEKLLPEDAACSFYLGRSLLAVGQTENAAAAMERAIERKPDRNEALPIFTELGRIYGRAGQSEKALGVWTKLEKLFPGDVKVGGQIARTFAEEGNVEEALKRYESLAGSARKNADKIAFAVQAAEMQRRLGKADEATASLEKILAKLRPGSWLYSDVRNRIEEGFLRSGDFDALAGYYQKKLETTKDDLSLQVRLGRVLVSAGRLDDAKTALEKAVESAPDAAEVRLALVDVLVSKADMAGAAKQYEKLAEQDAENPDYLLRWGQILLDDQDTELEKRQAAASKIWQRLADARPKDAVTLSTIADRLRSIDRTDDAIALYEKAINVDPGSPQYREYLGEYLYQLDRKDDAIKAWEGIAEGDRRTRDSLVRLAEVFGTFKQSDRSIKAWRDASKMDLEFGQELRFAKILRDAKEYDEALTRLDVAEKIAETPEENEQLIRDRIKTYQQAGTLSDRIADLEKQPESTENLRQLALMQSAASQLTEAYTAISKALKKEPENIDLLIVAAEITERQSRYMDAAKLFQKLAVVHNRYRTNYLQRTANLQMRLGEVDTALKTCEDLIDTNPARIDSYQFLATLAFRVGRDDQAITALRRAMNVAPRDNTARKMLAASFASRYRTEEAIELYWQAMRYEREPDAKSDLVKLLAPLYDRKTDMATLIRRVEEMGREEGGDTRTTQLMLASAHEAVRDYGEARQAIDRLLAQQPRDVKLLERMVRLSDVADEVATAAEFQEKIVALADTPENRMRLVQLQLDADLIDIETALSQRVSLASDPVALGGMIRSASVRGDMDTGIAICRAALKRDPSLWDVNLSLAQMLLRDKSDKQEEVFKEAIAILDDLRDADYPFDARPPTARKITKKSSTSGSRVTSISSSSWSQSRYTLLRSYRLGQYASRNYSSSGSTAIIPASTFGHARILASMLKATAIVIGQSGDERDEQLTAFRDEALALPPVAEVKDADLIREHRALRTFFGDIQKSKSESKSLPATADLTWRMAELDPSYGASGLTRLLIGPAIEAEKEKFNPPSKTKAAEDKKPAKERKPLTDQQLQLVHDLYEEAKRKVKTSTTRNAVGLWDYELILAHEHRRAGQTEKAKEYRLTPLADDAPFDQVSKAISFHLRRGDQKTADSYVGRLLAAARIDTTQARSSSMGAIRSLGISDKKFLQRHRNTLLDAFLARLTKSQVQKKRRGSSSLSDGSVRAYVLTEQGYYNTMMLKAPLSTELINSTIVSDLASLVPDGEKRNNNGNRTSLKIPADVLDHLTKPLEGAPRYEQKARRVLAAYAHWWDKRPEGTYDALVGLCKDFPDDVDLQIERARLASELKQPRLALETLDSFDPLDSKMMVRKEMAAMNLASRIGNTERAKLSAERLFGMRMDTTTQLALADQLRRLGMTDQASAVLQRMRGGRTQSESTELEIASAFLSGGQPEAAAEVAYNVLRKLNSGRSTNNSASYYRQRAVSVLKSAKKLEPLIERSERRLKSTPKSMRARTELAELLTAAGRSEDAEKLWEGIVSKKLKDPRQMIARAATLNRAKKYKEAAMMYLDAFEKNPNLFGNNYYEMSRAVKSAKIEDEMFERLVKMNPGDIPYYRMDEILRLGGSDNYSDAKRKFLVHAIQSDDMKDNFYYFFRSIPQKVVDKTPEIRQLMINGVCRQAAFKKDASVWSVSSYSSGGTAIGALKDCLAQVNKREKAKERFIKAAEKAKEDDATKRSANFLLAMLDIQSGKATEANVESIAKVVKDELAALQDDDIETKSLLSSTLLWQAGQILEETDGVKDNIDLLVDLYRAASEGHTDNSNSIQYTPKWRLITLLGKSKRKSEARAYMLDAYAAVDNSEQNQWNPGYGDYQDLQEYQSLAKALDDAGCPIDALVICQSALNESQKFELAQQWGGSRNWMDQFKQLAEKLTDKIDADSAEDYVGWTLERLKNTEKETSSDQEKKSFKGLVTLFDLPVSMLGSDSKSSLQVAIDLAKTTDSGKKLLAELSETASKLSKDRPNDWTLPATALTVALAIDSDDTMQRWEHLAKALPSTKPIKAEEKDKLDGDAIRLAPLVGLFTPLSYAANSKQDDAGRVKTELADYMKKIAVRSRNPEWQVATSTLIGDEDGSLKNFLASVKSTIQPGAQPSQTQVDSCIKIAKSAAKNGDYELSTEALVLALSSGPPLRSNVGTTSDDAFALNRNNSNPLGRETVDPTMTELTESLQQIIDLYSGAVGKELVPRSTRSTPSPYGFANPFGFMMEIAEASKKKDDKDDSKKPRPASEQEVKLIADALQKIVLPEKRMDVVYDYAKPIVSTSNYDQFNGQDLSALQPKSAALAMCRAAAISGQSDQLKQALELRTAKGGDKKQIATLLVLAAHATEDTKSLEVALDALEEAFKSDLPQPTETKAFDQLRSISSQMQSESFKKSEIINQVLTAVGPLMQHTNVDSDSDDAKTSFITPEISRRANDLLLRTISLIGSDAYTSQRHRTVATLLRQQMMLFAKNGGQMKEVERLVDAEIKDVRKQYENYGYSNDKDRENAVRSVIQNMLTNYAKKGFAVALPNLIRAESKPQSRTNLQSQQTQNLLLQLAKSDKQQQFDALKGIALGTDVDDPVLHVGSFLQYSEPPEMLKEQMKDWDAAKSLPVCGNDVPIVDSLLVLADLAAELGQSESLAKEIQERSHSPTDDAALAAAIVRLAGAKDDPAEILEQIKPTFVAMAKKLSDEKPTKQTKDKAFPVLAYFLTVRLTDSGYAADDVQQALRDLTVYAHRGNYHTITSLISRSLANQGVGRTANGQIGSPLKHFVSVPLNANHISGVAGLKPLYRMRPDGALSGTGGLGNTMLMFRYPVVGNFTLAADIDSSNSGDAGLTTGGILYPPASWNKSAKLSAIGSSGNSLFPVPSMKKFKQNTHAIKVSPTETIASCNDRDYVTDLTATSFPWVGLTRDMQRTSLITNIKLSGDITIPREVNLIDPTLRGWMQSGYMGMADPLLPIGPKQKKEEILKGRKKAAEKLEKEIPEGVWTVKDGELHLKKVTDQRNRYDGESKLMYMRPLLDGETVTASFWWKKGEFDLHPGVGRTFFHLSDKGTYPTWGYSQAELMQQIPTAKPVSKTDRLAPDVQPKDDDWNEVVFKRTGELVSVSLNGKEIVEFKTTEPPRIGFQRQATRNVRIRSIKLTGDWPEKMPADLLEKNEK